MSDLSSLLAALVTLVLAEPARSAAQSRVRPVDASPHLATPRSPTPPHTSFPPVQGNQSRQGVRWAARLVRSNHPTRSPHLSQTTHFPHFLHLGQGVNLAEAEDGRRGERVLPPRGTPHTLSNPHNLPHFFTCARESFSPRLKVGSAAGYAGRGSRGDDWTFTLGTDDASLQR